MSEALVARSKWALMAGNFAIGCGVMVTAGSLNDLVRSLQVSVAVGGQLISVGAAVIAVAAPLLAALLSRIDRRLLLTLALLWYAVGHVAAALMPSFAALLPVRALSILGAAVFTPQAAAAMNALAPPAERGRAMAFIFLGWSLSSVIGLPLHSYIGEVWGWRWAFMLVALLSAGAALWVWRSLPGHLHTASLSFADWRHALTHPLLMGMIIVTALSAAGQFTLFSYMAPYYRQVLGADAAGVAMLFLCFGAFGVLGNLYLGRWIERWGAARCVTALLSAIAFSLLIWPLAGSVLAAAVVMVPWALGCFSSNSAQQVRLGGAAPAFASALMALNTSAMYLGQALGAAGGGVLVVDGDFSRLSWAALAWLVLAIALSALLTRRMRHGALA